MPNRILKESICTSPNLDGLSPEEEVLFYRLLVNCDDYGRADARPEMLRSRCYPLRVDTVTNTQILAWIAALAAKSLVHVYTVDEHPYLQVSTWEKHQQVRSKRSRFPSPNGTGNQLQALVPVIQSLSESGGPASTSSTAHELFTALTSLKGWTTKLPDDLEWLSGFRKEFPTLSLAHIKGCRDFHEHKPNPHKGWWKTRLRNWMLQDQKPKESTYAGKPGFKVPKPDGASKPVKSIDAETGE